MLNILNSSIDNSVNFITDKKDAPGFLEARYVRRSDDYFIVYLSSQSGCDKACRMCHLTQTGQTKFFNASIEEYLEQADMVLGYYDKLNLSAKKVHFNFMSRGEVFANPVILNYGDELVDELKARADARNLICKQKFSTIMPKELSVVSLSGIFKECDFKPQIYYSLYSVNPDFRKRWLPKSLDYKIGLEKLHEYSQATGINPCLHWAFIEGENDSEKDMMTLCKEVKKAGIKTPQFNIVRYNPYSDKQGQEPTEEVIERNKAIIMNQFPEGIVKVIPRVGFDVKASCGMFIKN